MELLGNLISRLPRGWRQAVSSSQFRHPLFKRAFDLVSGRFKNRDGVIASGIGKGLLFNPGGSHGGYLLGTSEPGVQLALSLVLRPAMTFFDIGANVGFHSIIASRLVGPEGSVVAFEPVAGNARNIEHNALINGFQQVRIEQIALSDVDEMGRFWTSEESTWGSLVSTGREPTRSTGTIDVQVRRLDDLIEDHGLKIPEVIKIDVEGAEVSVLKGAAQTLRNHRPVLLIELHGTNVSIAEILSAANYEAIVFGSEATIAESSWDAFVAAAPAERPELRPVLNQLRLGSTGR